MEQQGWYCEGCGKSGTVNYKPHTDAMSVVLLIADSHHLRSPDCGVDIRQIRIITDSKALEESVGTK